MGMVQLKENRMNTAAKERLMLCVYAAAIFIVSILYIAAEILPLYPDPFGYISSGAYFAGYDWSSTAARMGNYYGFGYGAVLAPILALINDVFALRAPVVLLNTAALAGAFLLLTRIGIRLAKALNRQLLYAVCFAICMYAAYLFQVNFVIPEVLLVFCTVCVVFLLFKVQESRKLWPAALLGVLVGLMPSLHGRCLGIAAVTALTVLILLILKKISWQQLLVFAILIVGALALYRTVDELVKAQLYRSDGEELINTAGSFMPAIRAFFTPEGFVKTMTMLLSQFFYLGFSTGLLFTFGLLSGIVYVARGFFRAARRKFQQVSPLAIVKAFVIFNAILLCMMTAIWFQEPVPFRYDHILYGRHNEMMLPLVVLMGFLYVFDLLRQKHISKTAIIGILSFAACAVVATLATMARPEGTFMVQRTISGVALFAAQIPQMPMVLIYAAIAVIAVVIILALLRKKYAATTVLILYLVLFLALQLINGQIAIANERRENIGSQISQGTVQETLGALTPGQRIVIVRDRKKIVRSTYLLRLFDFRREIVYPTIDQAQDMLASGSVNGLLVLTSPKDLTQYKGCTFLPELSGQTELYIYRCD